MDAKVNRWRW